MDTTIGKILLLPSCISVSGCTHFYIFLDRSFRCSFIASLAIKVRLPLVINISVILRKRFRSLGGLSLKSVEHLHITFQGIS